jgi:hypothetical protein
MSEMAGRSEAAKKGNLRGATPLAVYYGFIMRQTKDRVRRQNYGAIGAGKKNTCIDDQRKDNAKNLFSLFFIYGEITWRTKTTKGRASI